MSCGHFRGAGRVPETPGRRKKAVCGRKTEKKDEKGCGGYWKSCKIRVY
jgi:hypothetical protein